MYSIRYNWTYGRVAPAAASWAGTERAPRARGQSTPPTTNASGGPDDGSHRNRVRRGGAGPVRDRTIRHRRSARGTLCGVPGAVSRGRSSAGGLDLLPAGGGGVGAGVPGGTE